MAAQGAGLRVQPAREMLSPHSCRAAVQEQPPPGCTQSCGTASQGHDHPSAAGKAPHWLLLCGNKGDNIHPVKSNETEKGFNPFIITVQSPMPQMAGGDGAGRKPGHSPCAACRMDMVPRVPAPPCPTWAGGPTEGPLAGVAPLFQPSCRLVTATAAKYLTREGCHGSTVGWQHPEWLLRM